jgi:hypothetical protein
MTHLPGFQLLHVARLLVAAAMMPLAVPQVSHALEPIGDTSCGQLGQVSCSIFTKEYWETATQNGCDHGLRPDLNSSDMRDHCVSDNRQRATMRAWTSNALRLQRELQADLPLNKLTVLGGHNAFNNVSDGYLIPNQHYSITDQLNMGVRLLALDIHWIINPLNPFEGALRLCHGEYAKIFELPIHAGCSPSDRPYFQIIEELNQWLRRPENSQEVVFLDLETYTDGHDTELLAPIKAYLAEMVFRPSMMPADGSLPTLNGIRALNKRVVIIGGNDAGNDLFIPSSRMESQPSWPSNFIKNFVASPCGYNINGNVTAIDPTYSNTTVRYVAGEDSAFELWPFYWSGRITNENLRQLTACNITGINLDEVSSDKLEHAVWSWDIDKPSTLAGENCAEMRGNGRWNNVTCDGVRRFACRNNNNPADWRVTAAAGNWQQGLSQCASEYPGYEFAVPLNGHENNQLAAAAASQNVWLNLNAASAGGGWGSGPQVRTVELRSLGKCMDDTSGSALTGASVKLWECHGFNNQKWILPGDGTIRSAIYSFKCLDLANSNTNNGSNILVWDCHGGNNQKWIVDGGYLRSALNRNKVIDVSGGNTANGTKIHIWDYNGGNNQQWVQVPR